MSELVDKLKAVVDKQIDYADRTGCSKLSTCSAVNWDRDIWNYRSEIIEGIRKRGYNVSSSTKHGVLDIVTTLKVEL